MMKGAKYYLQKSFGIEPLTRNNVEGHYRQIGAGYLFDSTFQKEYLARVLNVMLIFWMKYLLFPGSRKMHTHYMAHYLVHARVVYDVES
jgi:hypothetical protein